MDLAIEDRCALVTGASRGLGRAIALALASEGARVVALARNLERLNELAASCPPGRGSISARACDLSDASTIESLADLLAQVDILVLNTGGPPPGPITDVSDAAWKAQFEAMFLSAVRLTRFALPGMRADSVESSRWFPPAWCSRSRSSAFPTPCGWPSPAGPRRSPPRSRKMASR